MIETLKVSSKSSPKSVAGALAGVVRNAPAVEIQVVGAGALNQAIKAVAIARSYLNDTGMDLCCRPVFVDVQIDGESRTAIRLYIESCAPVEGAEVPVLDLRSAPPVEAGERASLADAPAGDSLLGASEAAQGPLGP